MVRDRRCQLIVNASSVTLLFQNKVVSLLKIMLINDEPLLSGQPPISSHLQVPRGWPLNGGLTVHFEIKFREQRNRCVFRREQWIIEFLSLKE